MAPMANGNGNGRRTISVQVRLMATIIGHLDKVLPDHPKNCYKDQEKSFEVLKVDHRYVWWGSVAVTYC